MATGRVVKWDSDKCFGFVRLPGGEDIFLHVAELVAGEPETELCLGVAVSFDIADSRKGRRATGVRLVPVASRPGGEPVAEAELREALRATLIGPLCDLLAESLTDVARTFGWVLT